MRTGRRTAALVIAASLAGGLAQAQPSPPKAPPTPPAATTGPAPVTADPPYEADLMRLAELMGTLAYLRDLCGDKDGAEWRKRMAALLDAEGRTETRKERLAGAFNRGFRGYQINYRRCTDAAVVVIARALDEGDRLSREITSRYGG